MKKILLSIVSLIFIVPGLMAQDYFFPARKGAELIYKYYDRNGREMKGAARGPKWTKFTVENVWPAENGNITINVRIEDDYLKSLNTKNHERAYIDAMYYGDVKIEGDSVVLDNMHQLLLKAYGAIPAKDAHTASVSINMTAAYTFPRKLSVGMKLSDREVMNVVVTDYNSEKMNDIINSALLQMGLVGKATGHQNRKFTAKMTGRKVEALEKIETPAGSFECYKMNYLLDEKRIGSGFQTITSYAEWISPKIGLVKRERYDKRGRTEETMILESYKP